MRAAATQDVELGGLRRALRVRASALAPHSWVDYLLSVRDLSTCPDNTQCVLSRRPAPSLALAQRPHPPSAHMSPARLCRTARASHAWPPRDHWVSTATRPLCRVLQALMRLEEGGDADAADANAIGAADEGDTPPLSDVAAAVAAEADACLRSRSDASTDILILLIVT